MAIPDFESIVVDRLNANLLEIIGLKRVYRLAPSFDKDLGDLPCAYIEIKGMTNRIPSVSAGQIQVSRDYQIIVIIAPATSTIDSANLGSDVMNSAILWINIMRNYFMTNPRLTTSTLSELTYLAQDITYSDQGIVQIGQSYLGIALTINTTMRGLVSRVG